MQIIKIPYEILLFKFSHLISFLYTIANHNKHLHRSVKSFFPPHSVFEGGVNFDINVLIR